MVLLFIFLLLLGLCASWLITCGLVYLIALCFNLTFSLKIATGIWLILLLIEKGIKITIKNHE